MVGLASSSGNTYIQALLMNSLSTADVLSDFVAFSKKNAENELRYLLFLGL